MGVGGAMADAVCMGDAVADVVAEAVVNAVADIVCVGNAVANAGDVSDVVDDDVGDADASETVWLAAVNVSA